MADAWPSLDVLLPHANPMILLDRVVAFDAPDILCATQVRSGNSFGLMIALEWMAQASAAYATLNKEEHCAPKQGYLIGVRDFKLFVDHWHHGHTLFVSSRHVFGDVHLGQFECSVLHENKSIAAQAILSVYVPSEELS